MHAARKSSAVRYSLLLGAICALFLSSCLKEPDRNCPTQYKITLGVQDKNYSNISSVSELQPKDETLPFKAYIGNISYQLQNIESGQVMINVPSTVVTGDQTLYSIDLGNIPEGRYTFTALGNTDEMTLLQGTSIPLHPNNQEHQDTYLTHDTIDISAQTPELSFNMNRTKGGVIIFVEDAPDSLARVDKQISNIRLNADTKTGYTGETNINKTFTINQHPAINLFTFVAPTVTGKKSILRLSLFATNKTTPYSILPDIELTFNRNELTALKVNFTVKGIEFWIYEYGMWQKLHDMDIVIN